ncbi:MAG: hybrid sensor histidine kinase/response regulator [Nibricoccus sp.]
MTPIQNTPVANILVVDDTAANLQLLTGVFKDHGYKVRPVTSGEMALRAIEAQIPDLILLDVTMPGMNGYEVCRRLKAEERWRDIPVLFISALNDTEDKVRAFQAGGVDYVSKPFQFEEVDARVRTHLELQRQKIQLRHSYAELKELETLRDSLTHMIAHDMRSPLAAVQLSLELLKATIAYSAESDELLTNSMRSISQLIELVSQLLDVSRLEAGKLELHRQNTNLVSLAQDALRMLQPLVGTRSVVSSATEPVLANVDPDLIRRVLGNLLGNALKFTPNFGEIRLSVKNEAAAAHIEVSDTGCGIAPEHLEKVFEKFGEVGQKTKIPGSGLGLTFSKMVVEAHGGQIGVISTVGQGSTFWLTLPK